MPLNTLVNFGGPTGEGINLNNVWRDQYSEENRSMSTKTLMVVCHKQQQETGDVWWTWACQKTLMQDATYISKKASQAQSKQWQLDTGEV